MGVDLGGELGDFRLQLGQRRGVAIGEGADTAGERLRHAVDLAAHGGGEGLQPFVDDDEGLHVGLGERRIFFVGGAVEGGVGFADGFLLSRFQGASVLWQPDPTVNVDAGLILTGEKLVDNPDLRERLLTIEPEAIGLEMEGAGVYTTCVDAGIPWIVIKGICDWGDGNKNRNKDSNQSLAARNAAAFVAYALGISPPLFGPAEKVSGPVIAHLYWLGSDLADGIRHVQEGQPISTLKKIVSQAARHFRKSGFKFSSIQDGLSHLEKWVGELPVDQWPGSHELRKAAFDAFTRLKSQVDVFINAKAGPGFDPDNG